MFLEILSKVRLWRKCGPAPEMKHLSNKEIDELMTAAHSQVGSFFREWLQGDIDIIPPAPEESCGREHEGSERPSDRTLP